MAPVLRSAGRRSRSLPGGGARFRQRAPTGGLPGGHGRRPPVVVGANGVRQGTTGCRGGCRTREFGSSLLRRPTSSACAQRRLFAWPETGAVPRYFIPAAGGLTAEPLRSLLRIDRDGSRSSRRAVSPAVDPTRSGTPYDVAGSGNARSRTVRCLLWNAHRCWSSPRVGQLGRGPGRGLGPPVPQEGSALLRAAMFGSIAGRPRWSSGSA
jgi:hypothetical protein